MSTINVIQLREQDLVAVAVDDIPAGTTVTVTGSVGPVTALTAIEAIPRGHKIALADYPAGTSILKYALSIGVTTSAVPKGGWIHSHNLSSGLHGNLDYQAPKEAYAWNEQERFAALVKNPASRIPKTFSAWRRPDGQVGIRNEIWVIPVVGCVNKTAENMADWARRNLGVDTWCFTHPFGCSQLGDDLTTTRTILANLARHPNAAGVLFVSLGCENLRLEHLKEAMGDYDDRRLKFLPMQDVADEIETGHQMLEELANFAKAQTKSEVPLTELRIGLKCGGSDGFSGITANPLVGRVTDLLVAAGGSAVQTEVPEMFGAETELMARSCSPEVFKAQVTMINNFKDYFTSHGQEVYENPSPGNRDGGITTLEEKSLGCIRKSGSTPVADVKPYGNRATVKGLTLVSGPGNDLVSTTNLSAAGAHVILFTTGRGTPFGAPAPTMKISTNTPLAVKKPGWIDYNAGVLLEGKSFDDAALDLLRLIIETAEGKQTKCELTGNRDIAIFKDGVIL